MPGSGLPTDWYDHVTLSHVVEHFHDPRTALAEVLGMLRPNGRVWIQIPNAAAASLSRFGVNSRLLEPPRHLVMFNPTSLRTLLEQVGFQQIKLLETQDVAAQDQVICQSWAMEHSMDPNALAGFKIPAELGPLLARNRSGHDKTPASAEIFVMTGIKP
jgi:2-polyprenyl-3-methyl-5-hydroxy-6-metoxy-1,4-benzoquinol methylase